MKRLNILLLLLNVVIAASAGIGESEELPDNNSGDSVKAVSLPLPPTQEEILQARLDEALARIDSLENRITVLGEDLTMANGEIISLRRAAGDSETQMNSLRSENSNLSVKIQNMDTLKIHYARNLLRYISTPTQVQCGINAIRSLSNQQKRNQYERSVLPLLLNLNNLTDETKQTIRELKADTRRKNIIGFVDWKREALRKLERLKSKLNVRGDYRYVILERLVNTALAQVRAAENETQAPEFDDIIAEFPGR